MVMILQTNINIYKLTDFPTFEPNFVHNGGQPPLGGFVGAAVVFTAGTFVRLQMDWNSLPQL